MTDVATLTEQLNNADLLLVERTAERERFRLERDAAIKRAEEWKGKAHDEALKRSEAEQNATRLATEKLALLEEVKRANVGWPSAIENIQQANEVIRELRDELAKTKNAGTVYEDAAKTWMQAHNDLRAENEKLRGELAEAEDRIRVCRQRYIKTTSEMATRINVAEKSQREWEARAREAAKSQRLDIANRFRLGQHFAEIFALPLVTDSKEPERKATWDPIGGRPINPDVVAAAACAPPHPEEPAAEAIDEWTDEKCDSVSPAMGYLSVSDLLEAIKRRNALLAKKDAVIAELREERRGHLGKFAGLERECDEVDTLIEQQKAEIAGLTQKSRDTWAAYCGADAQLKASQERERIIQDHRERACARVRELEAELEKARKPLSVRVADPVHFEPSDSPTQYTDSTGPVRIVDPPQEPRCKYGAENCTSEHGESE